MMDPIDEMFEELKIEFMDLRGIIEELRYAEGKNREELMKELDFRVYTMEGFCQEIHMKMKNFYEDFLRFEGALRSEERRVGKECRSRWEPEQEKENKRRQVTTADGRSTEEGQSDRRVSYHDEQ